MENEEKVLEDFEEEQVEQEVAPEENTEKATDNKEGQEENSEVTLDDLDSKAPSEKFRVISESDINEIFNVSKDEKGKVVYTPKTSLTISNIKLGKVYERDQEGNLNEPEVNTNGGKYYKSKLIVELEEEVNGDKIRIFTPSIFYGVQEDGSINKIPTVPKACADDKLGDNFTSELSQVRNKYCKKIGQDPKDVSSSSFVKGLIGMKFKPKLLTGDYKGRNWVKLTIDDFE